ncbi:hypothetical protein [Spiroplasma endosymbiont of Diplazon laetatorius]|uniref:hypothetical protein n=1 Tax=Spiroplasma endosymbiont of Diplazon laetatorius TaxID=3066322 RepID=UPI0030D17871
MKLNLESLIKKIDLENKVNKTDKFWIESAKKMIINNFEENISIDQLKLKISNLKVNNENEISIKSNTIAILNNLNKKLLEKNDFKTLNNKFIGKTNSGENQKFNFVDIKKENYILDTFSTENEKTECNVAFCRNISSYVRTDFTNKPILKNSLELYVALVLCNEHYNYLK